MLNYLKKFKAKDWPYIVEKRNAWYALVRMNKPHKVLFCQQKRRLGSFSVTEWHLDAHKGNYGYE